MLGLGLRPMATGIGLDGHDISFEGQGIDLGLGIYLFIYFSSYLFHISTSTMCLFLVA